jgi:DNA repair protein RadC
LDRFETLPAVLAASTEAISQAAGNSRAAELLVRVRAAQLHVLRLPLAERPILSSSSSVVDYLHGRLAHHPLECLHVLYLDTRNHLLCDEEAACGSVASVVLHPRAILRRALEVGATALVVVHNHPSGNPTPSEADCEATRRLVVAASSLDIRIHDHLVVARGGTVSFRAAGLL